MSSRQRLKELLLQLSYEKKEVTLASGKKSNFYFDGKQTALHPEGAVLLGELLFEAISKHFPKVLAVGGPTLGADPLVTAISIVSFQKGKPIPAFIIRKEPKKHGTQAWIEGFTNLKKDMPVVIVEDVVTTGGSSLQAVEKAIDAGLKVEGLLAVVDREDGGRENIEAKGYRFESLFKKSDLINDAIKNRE